MPLTRRDTVLAVVPLFAAPCAAIAGDDALELLKKARAASWGQAGSPPRDYQYSLTTELKTQGRQVSVPSKISLVMPDAFRQEVFGPSGTTVLVFDGSEAWRITGGARQGLPPAAAKAQEDSLARRHVLYGDTPESAWVRLRDNESIGTTNAHVIEIADVGGAPLRLSLHPETHDVLKMLFVGDVPGGGMAQVEEILGDYREIDGYRWAHRRETRRNGELANVQILRDVRFNTGVEKAAILG